jgi:catechol 2,3-dioxygenase-like lactoylglutathione lyase family enzyme
MSSAATLGVHHIGLTVSRLEESAEFFAALLGWKEVRRNVEYPAIYLSDGTIMLTLWAAKEVPAVPFNMRQNIGLHHVAFRVESENRLHVLHGKLADAGVEIEFAPEPLGNGPARHMMCFEPSGIRVEFIWPGN